jgi:hypothetical protein
MWGRWTGQVLDPRTSVGGMFLPRTLQNETGHHQDILSRLQTLRDVPNSKHTQVDQGIRDFHDRP